MGSSSRVLLRRRRLLPPGATAVPWPQCISCATIITSSSHHHHVIITSSSSSSHRGRRFSSAADSTRQAQLVSLQRRLGYCFRNSALLDAALTHASLANEMRVQQSQQGLASAVATTREQFEVLGDATLGLVTTLRQLDASPTASAGELTISRAEIVNNAHLAAVARDLQIDECLRASKNTSFAAKASANSVEAILGAIFLDSGRNLSEVTRIVSAHILKDCREPLVACDPLGAAMAPNTRASEKEARAMDVLIIGASSGIGAALARRLSLRGDHVSLCLVGRQAERLESVASSCQSAGARVTTVVGDVGVQLDVVRMAKQFATTMRHSAATNASCLPVVVCNAGIGAAGPTDAISAGACDAVLNTNVKGVLLTLRELMPLLVEAPTSQVVVTGSVLGLRPPTAGGNAIYTASKHAVEGIVDSVRNEYARQGVKIGVVNPGGVQTEWFHNPAKGGYSKKNRPDTARFLEVEEVVDALLSIIDQARTTDIRRVVLENHTSR